MFKFRYFSALPTWVWTVGVIDQSDDVIFPFTATRRRDWLWRPHYPTWGANSRLANQNIPLLHRLANSITVATIAQHCSRCSPRWTQSTPSHSLPLRSSLMLSSNLLRGYLQYHHYHRHPSQYRASWNLLLSLWHYYNALELSSGIWHRLVW